MAVVLPIGAQVTTNVLDYGAVGDGVTLDQAAFQTAATNVHALGGGTIFVPNGTYLLHRPTGKQEAVELLKLTNITFQGESRTGTVLKLNPQVGGYTGDAHLFQLKEASGISFSTMTMDGSRSNFLAHDEQMHGVRIFNSKFVTCDDVQFQNMRGDGIFTIGDNDFLCTDPPCFTEDVLVTNCLFLENGRSGIANQGGLKRISYINGRYTNTSDQDIDFEATGTRPGAIDVLVANNIFHRSVSNTTFAVTMGGNDAVSTNFVVTNNIIGGKVQIYLMHGMLFADNRIVLEDIPASANRALTLQNRLQDIELRNNHIESNGDFVVYLILTNVSGISIVSNEIKQVSTGMGIAMEQMKHDIVVSGNTIRGLTNSTVGISMKVLTADSLTRSNYLVSDNRVFGYAQPMRFGTLTNTSGFAGVRVYDNFWMSNLESISASDKFVKFKNGGNDDAPVEEISTGAIVTCNLCVPR